MAEFSMVSTHDDSSRFHSKSLSLCTLVCCSQYQEGSGSVVNSFPTGGGGVGTDLAFHHFFICMIFFLS